MHLVCLIRNNSELWKSSIIDRYHIQTQRIETLISLWVETKQHLKLPKSPFSSSSSSLKQESIPHFLLHTKGLRFLCLLHSITLALTLTLTLVLLSNFIHQRKRIILYSLFSHLCRPGVCINAPWSWTRLECSLSYGEILCSPTLLLFCIFTHCFGYS